MSVIDWILNLACVLLWLNWRAVRLETFSAAGGISILTSVKRAEPKRPSRWMQLAMLLGILVLRGVFYWNVGTAANWTPTLQLGIVAVPFRCDRLARVLAYSFLSFGVWLAGMHAWLLLLSAINRNSPSTDPIQRFVRLQAGRADRWPTPVKLLLLPGLCLVSWIWIQPLLVRLGILPALRGLELFQQAFLLACASVLFWKYCLLGVLGLHVLNSYLYLGDSPVWSFASNTASNLLRPLSKLPLKIGRLDLAPFLGIVIVWFSSKALASALIRIHPQL